MSYLFYPMLYYDLVTSLPPELTEQDLHRVASLCSKALKIKKNESISLSNVSLNKIQLLNKQTRHKDCPTDVLSFEAKTIPTPKALEMIKGDIVISSAYAKKEAARRSITLKEELIRLIIHGTLHLHGFDHVTEQDELQMFSLQESLVEKTLYPSLS